MVVKKGLFKRLLKILYATLLWLAGISLLVVMSAVAYLEYTSITYYSGKIEVTELGQCVRDSADRSECKAKSNGMVILSKSPMVIGDVMQRECAINIFSNVTCNDYVVPYEYGLLTEGEAWEIYEHNKSN